MEFQSYVFGEKRVDLMFFGIPQTYHGLGEVFAGGFLLLPGVGQLLCVYDTGIDQGAADRAAEILGHIAAFIFPYDRFHLSEVFPSPVANSQPVDYRFRRTG